MAWATIRRANDEDITVLRERAAAFCARHNIETYDDPLCAIDYAVSEHHGESLLDEMDWKRLNRLWQAVVRRALKHPAAEGIAYGYVGYEAP